MIELLLFGAMALAITMVVGLVVSLVGAVMWLVFLPFKLLGWMLKGVAMLALMPLLLVAGLVGAVVVGALVLVFATPLLPLIALVALVVWLARRGRPSGATA